MQMRRDSQTPDGPRARIYLATIQFMFVAILVEHLLRALPLSRPQGIVLAVLGVLTLTLLVVPRRQLATSWFIAILSLGDSALLLHTMQQASTIEPWITCEFLLLMVAVSYAPSVPNIVLLSSFMAGLYTLSLYRLGLFGPITYSFSLFCYA